MKYQLDLIRHDHNEARQTIGVYQCESLPRIGEIIRVTVETLDLTLVSQEVRVVGVRHWADADADVDVRIGVICELLQLNVLSEVRITT